MKTSLEWIKSMVPGLNVSAQEYADAMTLSGTKVVAYQAYDKNLEQLDDVLVEYEIASNRTDCFSVIGIAREAAATFRLPFQPPVIKPTGNGENIHHYIKVCIEEPKRCTRYTARVVKNIKIAPSPQWMQQRLRVHGIRPVNNITDIANYVAEEYGQPIHAYGLDTVAGKQAIVRRAVQGDALAAPDGREHMLDDAALLLEAACFRGTNSPHTADAVNRACQLIEELGAGEVVGGTIDIDSSVREEKRIPFEPDKYNRLLGTRITPDAMLGYFSKIELTYDKQSNEVLIPSWREDLDCGAALAAEVARFYGYDKIQPTLPSGTTTTGKLSYQLRIEAVARDVAEYCGFSQCMVSPFESPQVFDKLLIPQDSSLRNAAANPQGGERSILRTISLNGMLSSLALNANQGNKDVRLYELGNIYRQKELTPAELPDERMQFTLGMYGDGDFYTMKGVIEQFLQKTGMQKKPGYSPNAEKPFLHPGRQALIYYDGSIIGYLGEMHPAAAANYFIQERVYVAVMDMPLIIGLSSFDRKYQQISRFPAVTYDLSMVAPKHVLAGDIEKIIEAKGGQYLESYALFDIYEGNQMKVGYKSLAYSVTFRAAGRTLDEQDVKEPLNQIIHALEEKGIELRKQ
ncbi:MAG: phenylalanine--tRNA ligase subunit beta [Eubacterium sp.]|nr:phenylalanine--tRNA ligase subunit beta [Eubacterium sp.]